MAYVVCIGHCNLFSTIAEGFRTPSPFSGITSKGRMSNKFLRLCDITPKKYNPILQWIKNYSKKFLPLKGTLRDKQCLLYAKLGCARLQFASKLVLKRLAKYKN